MQVTVGIFAGRIAALDHKTGDDTVEANAVVKTHLNEIDKVFDVSRRSVRVKLQQHVAKLRRDDGAGILLFKLHCHGEEFSSTQPAFARSS